jgi:hypothetical protein
MSEAKGMDVEKRLRLEERRSSGSVQGVKAHRRWAARPPRSPRRTSHSRSVSAMSATALAYLRGTLHSFSESIQPTCAHDGAVIHACRIDRRALLGSAVPTFLSRYGQSNESIQPTSSHDMPLAGQHSTGRIVTEMLEQLNPKAPYVQLFQHFCHDTASRMLPGQRHIVGRSGLD